MVRQLSFKVREIDDIWVYSDFYNGVYDGRRLFAGYDGENEATRLDFAFGNDFDGYTLALQFLISGTWTTVATDTEDFYYDIEDTYTTPELIEARLMCTLSDQTLYSKVINIEIKR